MPYLLLRQACEDAIFEAEPLQANVVRLGTSSAVGPGSESCDSAPEAANMCDECISESTVGPIITFML